MVCIEVRYLFRGTRKYYFTLHATSRHRQEEISSTCHHPDILYTAWQGGENERDIVEKYIHIESFFCKTSKLVIVKSTHDLN